MPSVAPVIVMDRRDGDQPNVANVATRTHHRRMAWVREQLCERLRASGFRFEVRSSADCSSLFAELTSSTVAATPPVIVACEWELQPEQHEQLVSLHRHGVVRAVMLSVSDAEQALPTIGFQHAAAGAEAARHCTTAGFLRLLYCAPFAADWSTARAAGLLAAAREAGIAAGCFGPETGPEAALDHAAYLALPATARSALLQRLIQRGMATLGAVGAEPSTVIIACNDRVAVDLRLLLPDFPGGLMGFDDDPVAATHDLTSIRPPLAELARRASELIIRQLSGDDLPTRTALPWELVLRNSTRRQRPSTTQPRVELPSASATPLAGSVIQAPPTVALLCRGLPSLSSVEQTHAGRIERIRLSFLATMARAGVTVSEVMVEHTDDDPAKRLAQAADNILASGVHVVVVQEFEGGPPVAPLFAAAQAAGRIQVLYCETVGVAADQVGIIHDQGAAGSLAATHCLRQGFRRLLFLNPFIGSWGRDRALSARRALLLSSSGRSALLIAPEQPTIDLVLYGRLTSAQREAAIAPLLDEGLNRLKALPADSSIPMVLAATDLVALDVLRLMRRRGLQMGVDLGLLGFDDLPEAEAAGLTSVAPPLETMGSETGRLVLRLLRHEQISKRTCLPWTLMPRTSTRRV